MPDTENKNMELWNTLNQPIPPEYLKRFTKGSFSGTEIKPQYRLQRLTEVFGPQGIGWGYDIIEKWTETWPGVNLGCCYIMISLWYKAGDDVIHTSRQIGGTLVDANPDECWKAALTDAIGKCASMLGLGSDIYLGLAEGKYERATTASQAKTAPSNVGSRPPTAADGKKETQIPF